MSDEEKVVSWFEENYKSLIFGVVIGLTLLFGYKSYLSSQNSCLLYTSPSPRDNRVSSMPSSA